MPPGTRPAGTIGPLRATSPSVSRARTASAGSATIQRAASALPAAGVIVSGEAPAKAAGGTGGAAGRSASTPWKSTYEPISRSTSVCQSPVVVIMPTSAWGAALRTSTSCVLRRNTASSTATPPSATRTATRCGAGVAWQRRGRANGGNQQPRPASGIGDGLHRRRHGCRAGSAAVNEDFDAVQRCGDEQRLSRSGDEDDTRSTGSGLGSLRPAGRHRPGTNGAAQMSPATVSVTLQRAYNERLVMNSLPSQGAEPKGIV